MMIFVCILQPKRVGGCRHGNFGSVPPLSFPIQWPDSAAGETGHDADWSTAATCPASPPTPHAYTLDRVVTFRLQQSYRLQ